MFQQPLLVDDVDEVTKLARRVREKTSNMHAVYHQTDGDTAAKQVSVFVSTLPCKKYSHVLNLFILPF